MTAQTVLELALRSLRFLAREGLPMRGQDHRGGVFWQLMLERTYSQPAAREWLLRWDNWMGYNIQNEILERLAHAVQRKMVAETYSSPYYGLIADGTTDITSREQFSCHLFYTDQHFTQKCQFLGFYNASDTTSETLFLCIKDVFLRLNIPLEKLQGYCFDGANNMSGRFSGVQARLGGVCPGSLFVHCCNHSLDLVLQEVAREVPLIADTLQFVQSISTVIRESTKRKTIFESLFGDKVRCSLLGLCPTRWCVRANAISRVIRSFSAVLQKLQTLHKDRSIRGETRSKISGLLKQAQKGKTMFGLLCSRSLFTPCESVAKRPQAEYSTIAGVLECIQTLRERKQVLRTDNAVEEMLRKTSASTAVHNLRMPDPNSLVSKTPSKFRSTTEAEDIVPAKGVASSRRDFFEALDLVNCELERRFDQSGMATAALREATLLAATKGSVGTEADLCSLKLPENIDVPGLHMQLRMLGGLMQQENFSSLNDLAMYISNLHVQTRTLFKDVEAPLHLCLSLPVSVASSERSFLALRRLKTWLRNTVSQRRLTHLALLHMHLDTRHPCPHDGIHQRHPRAQDNLWSSTIR
ncbi:hypothetical protein PBY51_002209 [Eleginops maclovinus]|uniref:Zinc finger MYM-type protein 1 n=1 Tax=Eleginops maclovinus TaxID=56733 RepID=A0AAN8ADU6_ELEMC|nr:hypothetical protein PBY51_002209 [Eleginops maclovinus]